MSKLYFRNEHTGKRYRVVKLDKVSGSITLRGDHAEFTEKYDKEKFKSMGYVLEKEADEDDEDDSTPAGEKPRRVRTKEQNRFLKHSYNIAVTIKDVTLTLEEWIHRSPIERSRVMRRFMINGWTIEQALFTPKGQKPKGQHHRV
jgi:hypothetical protein